MTTDRSRRTSALSSAEQDEAAAERAPETPQTLSPSYRLAFADHDFLMRDELRGVRLQLELVKPELTLAERGIQATVVLFGSARSPRPDDEMAGASGGGETSPGLETAEPEDRRIRDYEEARALARLISTAENGCPERLTVVTGGGPGIMEAGNRGAADVGAQSIGLNIVLPFEQAPNAFITPELSFQFHYFAIRKMHFLMRARALVCFPGGFGTMDELFETLTLIQTKKIEPIPVLLFRRAWWEEVIDFGKLVNDRMISREDLELFHYVESAEEAWTIIRDFCCRRGG